MNRLTRGSSDHWYDDTVTCALCHQCNVAPTQSLKWPSTSRQPATVTSVHLPYSDVVLTGVPVQGADTKSITEVAKAVVSKLKKPLSAEELKTAVACAKFGGGGAAAEGREGLVEAIGGKVRYSKFFRILWLMVFASRFSRLQMPRLRALNTRPHLKCCHSVTDALIHTIGTPTIVGTTGTWIEDYTAKIVSASTALT